MVLEPECGENTELLDSALIFMGCVGGEVGIRIMS